jgi:hypothetical protein
VVYILHERRDESWIGRERRGSFLGGRLFHVFIVSPKKITQEEPLTHPPKNFKDKHL